MPHAEHATGHPERPPIRAELPWIRAALGRWDLTTLPTLSFDRLVRVVASLVAWTKHEVTGAVGLDVQVDAQDLYVRVHGWQTGTSTPDTYELDRVVAGIQRGSVDVHVGDVDRSLVAVLQVPTAPREVEELDLAPVFDPFDLEPEDDDPADHVAGPHTLEP